MNKHTKRFFKAKDLCRRRLPYLSALVFSMPCRPSAECETLAVDQCGRCSYNPEFVDTLSIEQLAYCILHECFHLAKDSPVNGTSSTVFRPMSDS